MMKGKLRNLDAPLSRAERSRRDAADQRLWEAVTADVKPLSRLPALTPPAKRQCPPEPRLRAPGRHLDLHGYTVAEAYDRLRAHLEQTERRLTVVTGRSGVIRREFAAWLERDHRILQIEELNGGGAFRLHLRK
jgi:DNA-nicking Smr family endonuclease